MHIINYLDCNKDSPNSFFFYFFNYFTELKVFFGIAWNLGSTV